jgi:NAD+ synthase
MAYESTDADDGKLDDRKKEVLSIYRKFHKTNRHKMDAIPVCIIPASLR